jgi:membrane dipeptidase
MTATAKKLPDTAATAERLVRDGLVISSAAVFLWKKGNELKILFNPQDLNADDLAPYEGSGLNVGNFFFPALGPNYFDEVERGLAAWNSKIAELDSYLMRITRPEDIDRAQATGRLGALLGAHSCEHFRRVDDVDHFHRLGLRLSLLTGDFQGTIGAGFREPRGSGLTEFGKQIVARMNKLGIIIDLSHANEQTIEDVCHVTTKPVILSHGNTRALKNSDRNETDEVIAAIGKTGGVFCVAPIAVLVSDEDPTTIEHYIDQIDHVVKVAGVDHVGIGHDGPIQGWSALAPENMIPLPPFLRTPGKQRSLDIPEISNPRGFYNIADALLQRGYSEGDTAKILGGNLNRAFRAILAGDAS